MVLSLRGITKAFEGQEVLKGISMDIRETDRIGIVGKNGAGKSTLMNILSGELTADSGDIIGDRSSIAIGYMRQESSNAVAAFVRKLEKPEEYSSFGDFAKAAGTMGLKEVHNWEGQRIEGMSGGERTKIALADILAAKPDLLILDEPTNHLDFQGVDWMIKELRRYRGTVLVISHDRYFLDGIVKKTIEIEDGIAREYAGNYTYYRKEKERLFQDQLHRYYEQEKLKGRIETEVERLQAWSATAHRDAGKKGKMAEMGMGVKEFYRRSAKKMDRRVNSKITRLRKIQMEGVEKPKEETGLNFLFNSDTKHGRRVLEVKELSKSYGERILFRNSSFYLLRGDKAGILGPNGCGKTTFVRMLLGEESRDAGDIWLSPSCRITWVRQGVEDLNHDKTVLKELNITAGSNGEKARSVLASLEIMGGLLDKPIAQLSPGERMRVKIASAILEGSDFLVLDEPASHLDLYSREQLEKALETFEGTLLLISHDRYMLDRTCSKILVFENRKIVKFEGGYREYRKSQERGTAAEEQKRIKEEKMVLENQMAALINTLGLISREDPRYAQLDTEYHMLLGRKRELGKAFMGEN